MQERQLSMNRNESTEIVELTKDNHAVIEKKYKDLHFSLKELIERYNKKELEEGFKETLLSLSEAYLMDLLKAFGYEGVLKKEKEERHAQIRSLNQENRELRKQLGDKVSNEDAREKLKNLSESVKKWWRKEGLGHTREISFGEYGSCNIELSCNLFGDFGMRDEENPITAMEAKKTWLDKLQFEDGLELRVKGSIIDDREIIDNDNNRNILRNSILKRFPSASIYKIENWIGRKKEGIIRSVTLSIKNLDDI